MDNSEASELRQLAQMVWHVWSPETRAAKDTIEKEQEHRIEIFRVELRRIIGDHFDINIIRSYAVEMSE